MAVPGRTHLAFHYDSNLTTQETKIQSIQPFDSLEEADKQIFKGGASEDAYVAVTESTIFHPQGGGQPSDEGTITSPSATFTVTAARTSATNPNIVLHLGTFDAATDASWRFDAGATVTQTIDSEKRRLYSRLHTAGHVLGSAVRHLLGSTIPDFDELKASHFPDSAGCEFRGSIEGAQKPAIQAKVDEFVAAALPVEVEWWSEADFRANALERLLPDKWPAPEGEKLRVVRISGVEVYPCGGTHVATTDLCGKTTVRKISRSKGNSRVSYAVE